MLACRPGKINSEKSGPRTRKGEVQRVEGYWKERTWGGEVIRGKVGRGDVSRETKPAFKESGQTRPSCANVPGNTRHNWTILKMEI